MKNVKYIIVLIILLTTVNTKAQIGIGTSTPNAAALLDVTSTNSGFLPPRMTYLQKNAISNPVGGLMIWCSDCGSKGQMLLYNGLEWKDISGSSVNPPIYNGTAVVSAYTCTTSSAGTMIFGGAVSGVTQTITATVTTVGTYFISTIPVNGVIFSGSGTFAGTGNQNIVLTATGTPTETGTHSFELNTTPNCNFSRTSVFQYGISPITFTYNGSLVTYGTVIGAGSKCWLDRNLGAKRVATSSSDAESYGDLFQWGRGADGHQLRTSSAINTTSSSDVPGHANFISPPSTMVNNDWRNPQNNSLWQGVSGINNPCPSGYRIPTYLEFTTEANSWVAGTTGPMLSTLKVPAAGWRDEYGFSGSSDIYMTISDVNGTNRWTFYYYSSPYAYIKPRSSGYPVRCIKD